MEIFAKGTFELHQWHSNVKELETACSVPVSEEETYAKEQLGTSRKEGAYLLGLQWNKECDTISINFPSESTEPTKRGILSKVAKIYDPLGLVSPITLGGKFLYRDICEAKLAWDAKLPSKIGSDGRRNFQAMLLYPDHWQHIKKTSKPLSYTPSGMLMAKVWLLRCML